MKNIDWNNIWHELGLWGQANPLLWDKKMFVKIEELIEKELRELLVEKNREKY